MATVLKSRLLTPYLSHFGMRESPFSVTASPRFAYASRSHVKAISDLRLVAEDKTAFGICEGVVGAGKTTLARILAEDLRSEDIPTIYLPVVPGGTRQSDAALTRAILDEFKLRRAPTNSTTEHLNTLANFGRENDSKGLTTVVLIDEAHLLRRAGVKAILRVLQLQTLESQLVQVILFGQSPEMLGVIRGDEALHSRLAARVTLRPFSQEEVAEMVSHRLFVAGRKDSFFTLGAIEALTEESGGVPRRICRIAHRACMLAFDDELDEVTATHIVAAAREVILESGEL
jgi:type II secretory pathway predicted ATPase ExeA